jgi:hypothetical protein
MHGVCSWDAVRGPFFSFLKYFSETKAQTAKMQRRKGSTKQKTISKQEERKHETARAKLLNNKETYRRLPVCFPSS